MLTTSSMAANSEKGGIGSKLCFLIYLVLLGYFLFFAEGLGRTGDSCYRYNLVLFQEIERYIYHIDVFGWKLVMLNVVGNVVAFMPFGYFIPRNSKYQLGIISTGVYSCLFSVIVEVSQYVTKSGSFDVDDLFLNTVGGLLGFIVFYILHRIINKKSEE